jgi:Holliday junction resolvasome RuvABC endonuclease subunit
MWMRRKGTVIGIDPSSKKLAAAIVLPGSSLPTVLTTITLSEDRAEACYQAAGWGQALVLKYDPVFVALEAPVMGRGGPGATIPQAFISGALQAGMASALHGPIPRDLMVKLVNNQSAKSSIIQIGNASKDDIADWVARVHPNVFTQCVTKTGKLDQDLCDAVMLACYGVKIFPTYRKINNMKEVKNARTAPKARKAR